MPSHVALPFPPQPKITKFPYKEHRLNFWKHVTDFICSAIPTLLDGVWAQDVFYKMPVDVGSEQG